ncbi:MAG: hypothetical protein ACT4QC_01650 [Planctomycetaceae bacterium]
MSPFEPVAQKSDTPAASLAGDLVDQVEDLLLAVERSGQPLEVDPHRSRLFELFVMADAGGFLAEEATHDLSCDGVGRELAARWDLARNITPDATNLGALPAGQLSKLRLLWAFMRMWMEWTYAWQRWDEFHRPGGRGA